MKQKIAIITIINLLFGNLLVAFMVGRFDSHAQEIFAYTLMSCMVILGTRFLTWFWIKCSSKKLIRFFLSLLIAFLMDWLYTGILFFTIGILQDATDPLKSFIVAFFLMPIATVIFLSPAWILIGSINYALLTILMKPVIRENASAKKH